MGMEGFQELIIYQLLIINILKPACLLQVTLIILLLLNIVACQYLDLEGIYLQILVALSINSTLERCSY